MNTTLQFLKRNLLLICTLGIFYSSSQAQCSWKKPIDLGGTYSTYTMISVYFTSSTQGWAVGNNGTILSTSNGGSTWSAQTSGTTNALYSVYFTSSTQGWAVGASGTILSTSNGGSTWSAQTSGTTNLLYSVYFTSSTQGWAVGNGGTILSTSNGGSTWNAQTSGTTIFLFSVCYTSSTHGWAVGASGEILLFTCTAPEINLKGNGMSIADGDATPSSADSTDFGSTATGSNIKRRYRIVNTGTDTLKISSIVSSGTHASEFVVSGAPSRILKNDSAIFYITFTPTAAGARTATITVNNNDANEAAYDFALTGTGTSAGFSCPSSTTLFVDSSRSSNGDGTSWATAFNNFDTALYTAWKCPSIVKINVAKGTYVPKRLPYNMNTSKIGTPITSTNNRNKTFHIRTGLTIEGGYATGGASRNISANPTVFNGGGVGGVSTDSAYHVAIIFHTSNWTPSTDTTVVDGIIFKNGIANGSNSITIDGVNNFSQNGGAALRVLKGNTKLINCTIQNNNTTGAGALDADCNYILVENCVVKNNVASTGAGLFLWTPNMAKISNCNITSNTTTSNGGVGINANSPNQIIIEHCSITNNIANYGDGGGVLIENPTNVQINHCNILNNISNNGSGGGVKIYNSTATTISNCIILNNTCRNYGGGIHIDNGNFTVFNNVFSQNTANAEGGGINVAYSNATTQIYNNTFYQNYSPNGAGIFIYTNTTDLKNNLFEGNSKSGSTTAIGADFQTGGICTNTFNNNMLQLAGTSSYTSTSDNELASGSANNIFATSPLFLNTSNLIGTDNIYRTADDGLNLNSSSPAINAGISGAGIPTSDIKQSTRVGNVDIGAYENTNTCKLSSVIPTAAGTYTSTQIGVDGSYTCYCDASNNLLLALDTTGTKAIISKDSVKLQIGSTATTSWNNAGGIIGNPNGGVIFNRKWDVKPTTQPTSPVKVKFFFTQAEYDSVKTKLSTMGTTITSPTQFEMYKLFTSGFGDPHANGATGIVLMNGSTPGLNNWKYTAKGSDHSAEFLVNSFSGGGGGAGAGAIPLPVEFISFTAKKLTNTSAKLNWQTASEVHSNYFEVERSLDGVNFIKIGTVNANGTNAGNYQYIDNTISIGTNKAFYRIKQIDINGKNASTNIQVVHFGEPISTINVYPNPFNETLNLELDIQEGETANVTITDAMGRVVYNYNTNETNTTLNLKELASGIYNIIILNNENTQSFKIMKQ